MRALRLIAALAIALGALVVVGQQPAGAVSKASFTFDFTTDPGDAADGPQFKVTGVGLADQTADCGGPGDAVVMVMVDPTGTPVDVDSFCLDGTTGLGGSDGDYGSFETGYEPVSSPVTYTLYDLRPNDLAALSGLSDSDQAYFDYVVANAPCKAEEFVDETDLGIPAAKPYSLCAKVPTFTDVPKPHQFYAQIEWLARHGIAAGYPDGTFQPTASVSRQAMASFFYKAAGSPTFAKPSVPTFSDVPKTHPFYREIEWMVANEIGSGYPDGTFRPTNPVSRQSAASFFYHAAGSPPVKLPIDPAFSDVPTDHPFRNAIEWAYYHGIVAGYPDGTFKPTGIVTRQAASSFFFQEAIAGRNL